MTPDGVFIFGAGFSTFAVRADGELLWNTRVGAEASFSSPALDTNESLYIGGRDNQLWKKETEYPGTPICKRYIQSDGDIKGSPTISTRPDRPNRVYVTSDIHVYAISTIPSPDPNLSCKQIWRSPPLNGVVFSSVSLADVVPGDGLSRGNLVVAAGSFVYLIRDDDDHATIVASKKIGKVSGPTPLIHPTTGNIYVGSQNKKFYGLSPTLVPLANFHAPGGQVHGEVLLGSPIWSSAALSADGNTIYVPTDDGKLHGIDALTGAERPNFPFSPPPAAHNRFTVKGYAPVVDGDGTIYIVGQDKFVRAIRPNGTTMWERKISGKAAPPTIVPRGLIVPSWDHNLYRFCDTPSCGFP